MNNQKEKNINVFLDELTRTLLYEGYSLYPYRSSAPKNKTPIPFGVIYPAFYCFDNNNLHNKMQTECIIKGNKESMLDVSIKFLQVNNPGEGWQAIEREVRPGAISIKNLLDDKLVSSFSFSDTENNDPFLFIEGIINIMASEIPGKENAFLVSVTVINKTPTANAINIPTEKMISQSFVSTHNILKTDQGEFISGQNAGDEWNGIVVTNENTWPVLIDHEHKVMLSSPIILYDYPEINAASKGDLFDSTEMEEALWLHVNVLTDEEKEKAMQDQKIRAMIDKAGSLTPAELIGLHDKMHNKIL